MRIVSQSGRIDLPYEKVAVSNHAHDEQLIIAYGIDTNDDNYWEMARYSTPQKARKAFEMLHITYKLYNQYSYMTAEQKGFFIGITPEEQQDKLLGIFRFPSDDEIEVKE